MTSTMENIIYMKTVATFYIVNMLMFFTLRTHIHNSRLQVLSQPYAI